MTHRARAGLIGVGTAHGRHWLVLVSDASGCKGCSANPDRQPLADSASGSAELLAQLAGGHGVGPVPDDKRRLTPHSAAGDLGGEEADAVTIEAVAGAIVVC